LPLPLVRISGVVVRTRTIPITVTLALIPPPAWPFDQDEFCIAATEAARRMNARKWLDRSTRHEGVEVDCESKALAAKRFLNTDPNAMREGWEARSNESGTPLIAIMSPRAKPSITAGASSGSPA
jgi:hypothetical protein